MTMDEPMFEVWWLRVGDGAGLMPSLVRITCVREGAWLCATMTEFSLRESREAACDDVRASMAQKGYTFLAAQKLAYGDDVAREALKTAVAEEASRATYAMLETAWGFKSGAAVREFFEAGAAVAATIALQAAEHLVLGATPADIAAAVHARIDAGEALRTDKRRVVLSEAQWTDLIVSSKSRYLGACCGNVAAARRALIEVRAQRGLMTREAAEILVANAGHHDVIERAFFDDTPSHARAGDPTWATDEGSPWPEIARACRAVLGTLVRRA